MTSTQEDEGIDSDTIRIGEVLGIRFYCRGISPFNERFRISISAL